MSGSTRRELPTGWTIAPISELFKKIVDGSHNPPEKRDTGYPMLSARNVENGHVIFCDFRYISPEAFKEENARTQIHPGDVLLTIVGTIGRSAVVPEGTQPFALQRSVAVLKPVIVLPKFYMYQFQTPHLQGEFADVARGTAQKGVYLKTLSSLQLRVSPLPEQHRIVAEIEKQFTRLDAGVAALERARVNLKRYRASVLKAACEGRLVPTEAELARKEGRDYEPAEQLLARILKERRAKWEADQLAKMQAQGKTPKDDKWKEKYQEPVAPDTTDLPELPEGWVWVTVEQLAASEPNALTDGPFGSNLKTSHYSPTGPRVIRLQNIGDGVFIDAYAHISQQHYDSLEKHRIQAGDLVIAALGENPPRACIIPPLVGPAIVKADCIRFKPEPQMAVPQFLNCALNAEPTRARTASIVHGVGRPRLNLGEIRAIILPLPPLAEQHRIVAEVERRLSVVDELEATIDTDLKRAERLRQSILKRAFEGKLVPQDPNDEPASVLLERIQAERQGETNATVKVVSKPKQKTKQPQITAATQPDLFR